MTYDLSKIQAFSSKEPLYLRIAPYLLAIAVLVVSVEGIMYWSLKQKRETAQKAINKTGQETDQEITAPDKTNSSPDFKTVEKALSWLTQQKNEDGVYYFAQTISQDNSKSEPIIDHRVGIYPVWAQFVFWQKTNDSASLAQLKTDLSTLNDKKLIATFQPDFWSCRLLYELYREEKLPKEVRNEAKNLCDRVAIGVPELNQDERLTSKTVIDQVFEKDLSQVLKSPSGKSDLPLGETDSLLKSLNENAAYSADFSALYEWEGDPNALKIAKSLFNLGVESFEKLMAADYQTLACPLGTASLDLYKATDEGQYLQFSRGLFERSLTLRPKTLFEKASCLLFVQELNEVSPEQKYQTYFQNLTKEVIENDYDETEGFFFERVGNEIVAGIKENSLLMVAFLSN